MTSSENLISIDVAKSDTILPRDFSRKRSVIHNNATTEGSNDKNINRSESSDQAAEIIVNIKNCTVGIRVKRGRDWIFGEQD